jgi:hypothetical protein
VYVAGLIEICNIVMKSNPDQDFIQVKVRLILVKILHGGENSSCDNLDTTTDG